MRDRTILKLEGLLAQAHRATYQAALLAESRSDQGLADDLHQLSGELVRITVDLLSGRASSAKTRAYSAYHNPQRKLSDA